MKTLTVKIYTLQSGGVIRYVGKTTKTLTKRLKEHLNEARGKRGAYRLNWLRSLSEPPTIELLAYVLPGDWEAAECYWIALARDYGCRLVNRSAGGRGGNSFFTAEHRAKLSLARLGRPSLFKGVKQSPEWIAARVAGRLANAGTFCSAETLEKLAVASRGRKPSLETRAKMSASARLASIGRVFSVETRERLAAANRGKIISPETRAKMSASAKARKDRNL